MNQHERDGGLAEYLAVLWSWRFLVLGGTLLAVVVALGLSLLMPKQYRATAILMIAESRVPAAETGPAFPLDRARLFADTYAELLRSTAAQTAKAITIDGASPEAVESAVRGTLAVRPVSGTLLLKVSVDYPDGAIASRIVDEQVTRAVAHSKELTSNVLTETRNYLEQQVEAAQQALSTAEEGLRDFRSTARHQEGKKRLELALEEQGELEKARLETAQEVADLEALVASMEQSLKAQGKILTLSRALVDDAVLREALEESGASASLLSLSVKMEAINPLFEVSEPEYVKQMATLAGAVARQRTIERQLTAKTAAIVALQKDLADKDVELAARELRYGLAKSAYESFSSRYESARLSVAAQTAELKIVAPAVSSPGPVSPRPFFNALVALIVGFTFSVFLALLLDAVRDRRASAVDRSTVAGTDDVVTRVLRSSPAVGDARHEWNR